MTKVIKIVKSFSNPNRWPISWLELDCGHTAKSQLKPNTETYEGGTGQHDDANHVLTPGDEIDCSYCKHYTEQLAKLRACAPGSLSHARFRHHDSRGFGPGSLYVYQWDDRSPTRCKLFLSIDDTVEANEAIRVACGTSPLSPTERR